MYFKKVTQTGISKSKLRNRKPRRLNNRNNSSLRFAFRTSRLRTPEHRHSESGHSKIRHSIFIILNMKRRPLNHHKINIQKLDIRKFQDRKSDCWNFGIQQFSPY